MEILGLGVDICEIARMEHALSRHPTLRERVFTPEEVGYCDSRARPAESYAGRFAAREAVIKAPSTRPDRYTILEHLDLDSDEVMMKLRAIDFHRSQLEEWRIAIREHPRLMQQGYGHEPYLAISSRAPVLTDKGLLGEFA